MKARLHRPLLKILVLAGALLLWPGAPTAWAADDAPAMDTSSQEASYGRGFALFQRYCRSCHGKGAEGDGHVAEYLKVEPTDLTRLALENDGEFPTEEVLKEIDGREEMVPLHGRDMPIWGSVFQVDEGQTEEDVQKKLADLIAFLKGIQVEDEAAESPED